MTFSLYVCLCVFIWSFIKTIDIRFRAHPNLALPHLNLTTSAKNLFLNKVTVWDSRWTWIWEIYYSTQYSVPSGLQKFTFISTHAKYIHPITTYPPNLNQVKDPNLIKISTKKSQVSLFQSPNSGVDEALEKIHPGTKFLSIQRPAKLENKFSASDTQ
jgi:hypothetical protein